MRATVSQLKEQEEGKSPVANFPMSIHVKNQTARLSVGVHDHFTVTTHLELNQFKWYARGGELQLTSSSPT